MRRRAAARVRQAAAGYPGVSVAAHVNNAQLPLVGNRCRGVRGTVRRPQDQGGGGAERSWPGGPRNGHAPGRGTGTRQGRRGSGGDEGDDGSTRDGSWTAWK